MRKTILRKLVMNRIASADAYDLEEIRKAVVQRSSQIFPDWELVCVSMPRNDKEARIKQIEWMLELEQRHDP